MLGSLCFQEPLSLGSTETEWDLEGNELGIEAAKTVADTLRASTSLIKMNLVANFLSDPGVKLIADSLKTNTSLTCLCLGENQITDSGAKSLASALKTNTNLSFLSIPDNPIDDSGAKFIAEALKINKVLTILDLSANKIGDGGARSLAEAIRTNGTLTTLKLRENELGDTAAKSLSDALKANTSLETLELAGNAIGAEGAALLAEALKANSSLTVFDLEYNAVGDKGAKAIADALKINAGIKSLILAVNTISDPGATAIAEALKSTSNLNFLDISGNSITDDGVKYISEALVSNSSLTILELAYNPIGDVGANHMAKALETNNTLTSLSLGWNSVSTKGETAFADSLKFNKTLKTLKLKDTIQPVYNEAVQANQALAKQVLESFSFDTSCKNGNCRDDLADKVCRFAKGSDDATLVIILNMLPEHKSHWRISRRAGSAVPSISSPTASPSATSPAALFDNPPQVITVLSSCVDPLIANLLIEKRGVYIDRMQEWYIEELLRVILEKSQQEERWQLLIQVVVRQWARVGNWNAVKTACLHAGRQMRKLDLSYLRLRALPPDICSVLSAVQCAKLDLTGNLLEMLPSCLHSIAQVSVDGNPLGKIPDCFRGDWDQLSLFLKYNGKPTLWYYKKLLMVGEEGTGKTTLLRCIISHKGNTDINKNVSTDGIEVHKSFSMKKASKYIWTAWDLGGQEVLYPSHQFFLQSESSYLLVFNIAAVSQELQQMGALIQRKAPDPPSFRRVVYWLKQIKASQRVKLGTNASLNAHHHAMIAVGTHLDQTESTTVAANTLQFVLERLLEMPDYQFVNCVFAISCKTGEGLCMRPSNSGEAEFTTSGVPRIVEELEEMASKHDIQVPVSWANLHNHLTKKLKGQPTIMWSEFTTYALDFGIGKTSISQGSQLVPLFEELVDWDEVDMCSDFLADTGAIIHFRFADSFNSRSSSRGSSASISNIGSSTMLSVSNPKFPPVESSTSRTRANSKNLKDVVVLEPQWLSDVMRCVITVGGGARWLSCGFMEQRNLCHIFSKFPVELHRTLLELLQVFEIAHIMADGRVLIPCLLPPSSPLHSLDGAGADLWCPFSSPQFGVPTPALLNTAALCTREFQFPFIPSGFFSRLTVRLLGIPGVVPQLMWNSGVLLSIQENFPGTQTTKGKLPNVLIACGEQQNLLIQMCAVQKGRQCSIGNLTSSGSSGTISGFNLRDDLCSVFSMLVNAVIAFVRSCYPKMFPDMFQVFPCPYCMAAQHIQQCSQCITNLGATMKPDSPSQIHVFSTQECVVAVKSRDGMLHCSSSRHTLVPVSIVSPDIALTHLPILNSSEINLTNTNFAHGGFGRVMKGEWKGQLVAVKEPHSQDGLADFVYEAGVMNMLPRHDNLVRFFGVCLQPQLQLVMEFVSPVTCCGTLSMDLKKPDLHTLLNFMMAKAQATVERATSCQEDSGESSQSRQEVMHEKMCLYLNEVFPMELRKKIVHDMVCGLNHLHSQSPPLVHSDLHCGNIFVCSLDPQGPGPWAKISDFGLSEFLFSGTAMDERLEVNVFAPEVLRGAKHDTKADVWSLGMLVRHIIDPFTSAFYALFSNPLYAKAVLRTDSSGHMFTHHELNQHAVKDSLMLGKPEALPQPPPLGPLCPKWAHDLMSFCWVRSQERPSCSQLINWLEGPGMMPPLVIHSEVPCTTINVSPLEDATTEKTVSKDQQRYRVTTMCWVSGCLWCGSLDGTITTVVHCSKPKATPPNSSSLLPEPNEHYCFETNKWRAHTCTKPGIASLVYCQKPGVVISATESGELKLWLPKLGSKQSISMTMRSRRSAPPTALVMPNPVCTIQNLAVGGMPDHTSTVISDPHRQIGIRCMVCVSGGTRVWSGDGHGTIKVWECTSTYLIPRAIFSVSECSKAYNDTLSLPNSLLPSGNILSMSVLPVVPHTTSPELVFVCSKRGPIAVFSDTGSEQVPAVVELLHHPNVDLTNDALMCVSSCIICQDTSHLAEPKVISPSQAMAKSGIFTPGAGTPPITLSDGAQPSAAPKSPTEIKVTPPREGNSAAPESPFLSSSSGSGPLKPPSPRPTPIQNLTKLVCTHVSRPPLVVGGVWVAATSGTVASWDIVYNPPVNQTASRRQHSLSFSSTGGVLAASSSFGVSYGAATLTQTPSTAAPRAFTFVPKRFFSKAHGTFPNAMVSSCVSSIPITNSSGSNPNPPTATSHHPTASSSLATATATATLSVQVSIPPRSSTPTSEASSSTSSPSQPTPLTPAPTHHHVIVSASQDGVVIIWDAQSHTQLCKLDSPNHCAVNALSARPVLSHLPQSSYSPSTTPTNNSPTPTTTTTTTTTATATGSTTSTPTITTTAPPSLSTPPLSQASMAPSGLWEIDEQASVLPSDGMGVVMAASVPHESCVTFWCL